MLQKYVDLKAFLKESFKKKNDKLAFKKYLITQKVHSMLRVRLCGKERLRVHLTALNSLEKLF